MFGGQDNPAALQTIRNLILVVHAGGAQDKASSMDDDKNRTGIVAARRPHGDMDISWNRDIVDGLVRHSGGTGGVPLLTYGDK